MKTLLLKLSKWLKANQAEPEAGEVKELSQYDEPWHEEAVKEFGAEPVSEEEYLEENFEYPLEEMDKYYENHLSALKQEGFIPLGISDYDSPILGRGSFGVVFRGVYQGKPAAAKVSINKKTNEVDKWKAIMKAGASMDPALQKHIPTIYKAGRGKLLDSNPPLLPYEIIIMEELLPLSKHLQDFFQRDISPGSGYLAGMKDMMRNPKHLNIIAKRLAHDINERVQFMGKKYPKVSEKDFFKFLANLKPEEFVSDLQNGLLKHLEGIYGQELPEDEAEEFKYAISRALKNMKIYDSPGFPETHSDDELDSESVWSRFPETESFYQFLLTLRDQFGIKWNDTHGGNVMMGKDGNLKLIDVGLFDLK